jgi:HSP20 family molecular chaperone IbpA
MTALLPRLFGDMNDWFQAEFPRTGPMMRIEDRVTDTAYPVRAELPGPDPEKDVQITVERGMLTVRAERREEQKDLNRTEFRYGVLHRTVRLPANADEEHIAAAYRDGILEITVPLNAAESGGREIPITGAE